MVTLEKRAVLRRASQRSTQSRVERSAVRHELAHGVIPPAAAVHDARAGVMTAFDLARAVPGVGSATARHVLGRLNISERKRIRELTTRQKDRLALLLEVVGR